MAKNCAVFDGVTEIYQTAEGTAIILSGGVLGSKQVRTTPRAGSKTDDITKAALEQLQVREVLAELSDRSKSRYLAASAYEDNEITIIAYASDRSGGIQFTIKRSATHLRIALDITQCQITWDKMYRDGQTTLATMNLDFLRSEALKTTELLQSHVSAWGGLRISFKQAEEDEVKELEESFEFAMRRGDLRIAGELTYDPTDRVGEVLMSANKGDGLAGDRVDAFVLMTDTEVIVKMTYNGFGDQGQNITRKVVQDWLNEANLQLPIRLVPAHR